MNAGAGSTISAVGVKMGKMLLKVTEERRMERMLDSNNGEIRYVVTYFSCTCSPDRVT